MSSLGYFTGDDLFTPLMRRIGSSVGNLFSRKLSRFARGYPEDRLGWADVNPAAQSPLVDIETMAIL